GFNGNEVRGALDYLHGCGVFLDIISEKLGTVKGEDGTIIDVDDIFTSTYPGLYDSLYVVGGRSDNEAKINQDIHQFIREMYSHFKPMSVSTTTMSFFKHKDINRLAGDVFASNKANF